LEGRPGLRRRPPDPGGHGDLGADGTSAGESGDPRASAPVSPRLDPSAKLAALNAVVAALAHPARRQMLLTIHLRGEMSAGDVAARFSHAWPTTTRHLRVLEHAGLVRFERQGRRRVYRVEHARLGLVTEWLSWFDRPAAASATVRRAWGR